MIEIKNVALSIVMPVYNEEENIVFAIEKTMEESSKFKKFELIVIDDGSTDNTNQKLIELSIKYKNLIIIKHDKNKGLGQSLKDGFLNSNNDYIIFNSADLPLKPSDICKIIEEKMDCDLLVVERVKYLGASLWRKFVSVCNRIILHIAFPLALIDIADTSYTIVFKKSMLNNIFPHSTSPGFILTEMILKAKYFRYDVKSTMANYYARIYGKTIIGGIKDILVSFYDIMCFRIYSYFIIVRKK